MSTENANTDLPPLGFCNQFLLKSKYAKNNSQTAPLTLNSLFKGRGPSQNSRSNDDSFYTEAIIFPSTKDHVAEGENLNVTSSLFNTKHKKRVAENEW